MYNWWKILVVIVLFVAVGGVIASRNDTSPQSVTQAVKSPESLEETQAVSALPDKELSTSAPPEFAKPEDIKAAQTAVPVKPVKSDKQKKADPANQPAVSKKPDVKQAAKPETPAAVSKKLPKMIELGAEKCMACKMMKPIVEDLQKSYKGKIEVVMIDVWKDEAAAEKYNIQSIPTQVFLDENGNEFFRHVGFFPKENILKTFEEKGYKLK